MRILIGGMNGAGKSTLACSLYLALRELTSDVTLHEVDPWSDTHDCILGHKPWSERNKRGNFVRNHLASEFAERAAAFAADDASIVLGDLHGRWQLPDFEYWEPLRGSGDALLVTRRQTAEDFESPYPQDPKSWLLHLERLDIPVRWVVSSHLEPVPDQQALTVSGLDRLAVPDNSDIVRLARTLLDPD